MTTNNVAVRVARTFISRETLASVSVNRLRRTYSEMSAICNSIRQTRQAKNPKAAKLLTDTHLGCMNKQYIGAECSAAEKMYPPQLFEISARPKKAFLCGLRFVLWILRSFTDSRHFGVILTYSGLFGSIRALN